MNPKHHVRAVITAHVHEANIHTMTLHAPEVARDAKPGQFVMVYLDKGEHLLPRPISIYDVDRHKGEITLVYAAIGAGTDVMSKWQVGHNPRILGALGNGFDLDDIQENIHKNIHKNMRGNTQKNIPKSDTVALVGGGLGAAPLFFLAKELRRLGVSLDIFLGFRTEALALSKPFEPLAQNLYVATEDGSGQTKKGYVTDFLIQKNDTHTLTDNTSGSLTQTSSNDSLTQTSSNDSLTQTSSSDLTQTSSSGHASTATYAAILACGPTPMLKILSAYAREQNIPCQVSVEERMACGLGACKGCVVRTLVGYQLCCLVGPVFDSKEVQFDAK